MFCYHPTLAFVYVISLYVNQLVSLVFFFSDGVDPPNVEKRTQEFLNREKRNKESLGRLFVTFFVKVLIFFHL